MNMADSKDWPESVMRIEDVNITQESVEEFLDEIDTAALADSLKMSVSAEEEKAMKSASELYASLTKENTELATKIIKVEKFMKTDDYRELTAKEQRLLVIQQNIMWAYADILLQRIDEAKDQEITGKTSVSE